MTHRRNSRHIRRASPDDAAPSVGDFHGTATVATNVADGANTIVADSTAVTGVPPIATAPDLASVVPTITGTDSNQAAPTPSETAAPSTGSATTSASSASGGISVGTVVGACAGALIGAILLILVALWYYKRSGEALKKQRQRRQWHGGEGSRARARSENWNKLDSVDQDKWDGMMDDAPTKEAADTSPATEKFQLFKSTSIRTTTTERTDFPPMTLPPMIFNNHPFAQSPKVTRENEFESQQNQVLENANPVSSWHETGSTTDSFVTLRPRMSQRAMSPTVNSALRTPTVTSSEPHMWEAAEFVQIENDDEDDDEGADVQRRKSTNNPFFSSRDRDYMVTAKDKGKQRANNPFDTPETTIPTSESPNNERTGQHISMASDASNDRAIQSLIAVLDGHHNHPLPTDARTVRPPSTQASFTSVYASAEDGEEPEEDLSSSFPHPPQGYDHSP